MQPKSRQSQSSLPSWRARSFPSMNSTATQNTVSHSTALEMSQRSTASSAIPVPKSRSPPITQRPSATNMERSDSGYSSCPRASTDETPKQRPSLSRRSSSRRKVTTTSPTRPVPKRASRSSPCTRSLPRPHVQARYATTRQSSTSTAHQFFQFPSLDVDNSETEAEEDRKNSRTPPPATVHYWTSEETRRLEYAAIDAASRGVRGFLRKLVPECVRGEKRGGFYGGEDDDCGSVRRYRLSLSAPPEKEGLERMELGEEKKAKKGFWRRWTSLGKKD
jgi:hypothetical protein